MMANQARSIERLDGEYDQLIGQQAEIPEIFLAMTERVLRADRFIASFGIIVEKGFVRIRGGTTCYIAKAERVRVSQRWLSDCNGYMQVVRCVSRLIHTRVGRGKPLGCCG